MSRPEIELRYPLAWPDGRPRITAPDRTPALFRDSQRRLTWSTALPRLRREVYAMTRNGQPWRTRNLVLSTNIRFTLAGTRDQNLSRRDPDDPGVAFFFDLDRRPHVLACDRWDTVYDNVAAIAAHIEALRGQERWGVADLAQAFAGHAALPPPPSWRAVLGFAPADGLIRADVDRAYRALARELHPDTGGDRAAWDRLTAAYAAAKKELSAA